MNEKSRKKPSKIKRFFIRNILSKIPFIKKYFIHIPYAKILNFKREITYYKDFCLNINSECTVYSDWENHIKEKIQGKKLNKSELNNFKQYCEMERDSIHNITFINMSILIGFAPSLFFFLLTDIIKEQYLNTNKNSSIVLMLAEIIVCSIIVIFFALLLYFFIKKIIKLSQLSLFEVSFYNNLIKVIDICEKELEKPNVGTKVKLQITNTLPRTNHSKKILRLTIRYKSNNTTTTNHQAYIHRRNTNRYCFIRHRNKN